MMDGWIDDGWKDGWMMYGCVYGWIDDGWKDRLLTSAGVFFFFFFPLLC